MQQKNPLESAGKRVFQKFRPVFLPIAEVIRPRVQGAPLTIRSGRVNVKVLIVQLRPVLLTTTVMLATVMGGLHGGYACYSGISNLAHPTALHKRIASPRRTPGGAGHEKARRTKIRRAEKEITGRYQFLMSSPSGRFERPSPFGPFE